MSDNEASSRDKMYFSHPFMARVHGHKNAHKAFSKSKLSTRLNCNLMYCFVSGASYNDSMQISVSEQSDEPATPDTKFFPPEKVSIQSIRKIFARWRLQLFRNKIYRAHILSAVFKNSQYANENQEIAFQGLSAFDELGINDKNSTTDAKVLAFWTGLKHCVYECPASLTLRQHKSKYNSLTIREIQIAQWRFYLREDDLGILDWRKNRLSPLLEDLHCVGTKLMKKSACRFCPNQAFKNSETYIIQSVLRYLAPFRITDNDTFHDVFFSALIFAYCQAEIGVGIDHLKYNHERWSMLSGEAQEVWRKSVYEIDHSYSRLVNLVAGAMIDCLARGEDARVGTV